MSTNNLQQAIEAQAYAQAANRSALTAKPTDPAFAEILAMKTLSPEELEMFAKTKIVNDENGLRYVKEEIYNLREKGNKQIEEIVTQRIADVERIQEMQLHDYKFAMGSVGQLIMVIILTPINHA